MQGKDQIETQQSSIQEFLRKRAEIEQTIRQKFQREITVMFTDIASSTEFYEKYGDIEGRAMIQRHNDLLTPIVAKYGGQVLRVLGDGLMATFEIPPNAARAAVEIQRTLAEENRGKSPSEQIWVKAAIHHGLGIVEAGDVYGDMVNTLARICALTRKGDVQVSQAFVDHVKEEDDIYYDYVGVKNLKGKSAPVEVYRIIWDPAQMEDLKRSPEGELDKPELIEKTIRLVFSLLGDRLRLAVFRNGHQAQIFKQVHEFAYQEAEIRNLVEEIDRCLTSADERGRVSKDRLLRMQELGKTLYGMLIPDDLDRFIGEVRPPDLVLQIDTGLAYIPWELLYDGNDFFCVKYNMGRIVSASQQPLAANKDLSRRPLRILLVADPRGDLPASKKEGIGVQRELNRSGNASGLSADLRSREVTSEFLRRRLGDYELLHYAGHFDYDKDDPSSSGLLLADGKFEVGQLLSLAREAPLPSLVFTNACQSGRTEGWSSGERLYGLANAFLVSGVRHYVGGSVDLQDRSSAAFAEEFYRQLARNRTVGEALRRARIQSMRRYGEENLTWASYVLYGDPGFRYFEHSIVAAKEPRGYRGFPSMRSLAVPLAATLLVVVAALMFFYLWHARTENTRQAKEGFNFIHAGQFKRAEESFNTIQGKSPLYYQGMSALALNRGNVEDAMETLSHVEKDQPGAPYLGVLKAHLTLNQGNLDEAASGYRKGLESQGLERWQQAECHFGLGRVFMIRGDLGQAVTAFDEAIRLDPSFLQVYTAKGLALERLGRAREAVDSYQQAALVNPEDPINLTLYGRSREHLNDRDSSERRSRIDQLVSDLLQRYREGPRPAEVGDEWSSRPLYLFFLSLETKGQPSPREGEDAYVDELISRDLKNSTRFQLVERRLLERLLEELKLSSSQLADPQTALRLGNILSARILITGALVRYKGQLKVNLRAVDTENTRVTAIASGSCPFGEDPERIVEALVGEFLGRITSAYPIRGKVTEVQSGAIGLNVGRAMGVTLGMKFRVVENGGEGTVLTVGEVGEMSATAVPQHDQIQTRVGWRIEGI